MNQQPTLTTDWAELHIATPPGFEDIMMALLVELASNGIETRDEITSPRSRFADELEIVAYFPAADAPLKAQLLATRLEELALLPQNDWAAAISIQPIATEDWTTSWQKHFHTRELTARIVIQPSWETYTARPDQIVIEIDPAMAFGTGEHETTQLCVQALEQQLKPGQTVIDLGTGTAILAMVAEKLGAARIVAIDNDIDAIQSAAENLTKNKCRRIELVHADAETSRQAETFDLIIGNLQTNIIKEVWPTVIPLFKPDSIGIFSGILLTHQDEITRFWQENGFHVIQTAAKNEWLLAVIKKSIK